MNRLKLALKVQIIVLTSLITTYINKSKSHLTSPQAATTSKRNKQTYNNRKETPTKIVSKATAKIIIIQDTTKKKGKPRIKIKAHDKTTPTSK